MPPLMHPSKRAYEPILGQGSSQPYQVPPEPNHSNDVKRQRTSEAPGLGFSGPHKEVRGPLRVYSLPQQAIWKRGLDQIPIAPRFTPSSMIETSSSGTNDPSKSLEIQKFGGPLELTSRNIGNSQSWNHPPRATTPTSESHTLESSLSTGEWAEWKVDSNPTLDAYSYSQVSAARTEPDISYALGNSGHIGSSSAWNSISERPSCSSSTNAHYHELPSDTRVPEIHVEPSDTNCEYSKPSMELDNFD